MRGTIAAATLAGLLVPAAVATAAPASAAGSVPCVRKYACPVWNMVDAVSARDVWAAGADNFASTTVFEHWNGKKWHKIPSPGPVAAQIMAASSADNLWAETEGNPGMAHWNGRHWKQMSDGHFLELNAMAAVSATNVWGVGAVPDSHTAGFRTLILHWNGRAWKREPSPAPAGGVLMSIDMLSASSGWAVGQDANDRALALRWNGRSWQHVPVPSPGGSAMLTAVDASSFRNTWAIGTGWLGGSARSVIMRWNGTSWQMSKAPSFPWSGAFDSGLDGLAAISARDVWAAGWNSSKNPTSPTPVFLRWNGKSWHRVKGPKGMGATSLSAKSARDIWAVGTNTAQSRQAIWRWNRFGWKAVLRDY
jgi:hypothetical protein